MTNKPERPIKIANRKEIDGLDCNVGWKTNKLLEGESFETYFCRYADNTCGIIVEEKDKDGKIKYRHEPRYAVERHGQAIDKKGYTFGSMSKSIVDFYRDKENDTAGERTNSGRKYYLLLSKLGFFEDYDSLPDD